MIMAKTKRQSHSETTTFPKVSDGPMPGTDLMDISAQQSPYMVRSPRRANGTALNTPGTGSKSPGRTPIVMPGNRPDEPVPEGPNSAAYEIAQSIAGRTRRARGRTASATSRFAGRIGARCTDTWPEQRAIRNYESRTPA